MGTSSSSAAGSSTVSSPRRFGAFELDVRAGELRKDGAPVKLQPQPFKVLALLVDRAGELVTRDELKKALWGEETYVDFERGLNFSVNQVRVALADSAEAPQFIQTVPRRGYRFIAPVQSAPGLGSDPGQTGVRPGSGQGQTGVRPESDQGQSQSTRRLKGGWQLATIGVAILATLVAAAAFLAGRAATPAAVPAARTMVAVLPLDDLTGDQPPSWFADGLTEELIAQLGRVSPRRLGVIARTSSMAYRGSNKTVAEIGRELGVSHLLEGSVRRDGNRLRITVQLVGVADQTRIWSQTFDRTAHGALTIQSEVAAQVTRALALELAPGPWTDATWAATPVPEARDAYLRGKYFGNRGLPGDLRTALDQFQEATRLDSKFAAAFAAQVDTYHLLAMFGQMPPADAYARAADAARAALRVDPNLADAHAATGLVQLWSEWDPSAAAVSFERAIALNPSDAGAHHDLAFAMAALQRFDEAVAHITRARDLDPLSPRASNDIGWLYLQVRQPLQAARACRQTLALDPESVEAQQCLERAHLQRGEFTEALAAARAAAERSRVSIPVVFADGGSPESRLHALWRWRLERLRAAAADRYVSPYTIAMHHVVLGEDDQALARLEQGLESRVASMVLLPTDPVFDRLRSHPRFVRLVAQIAKAR